MAYDRTNAGRAALGFARELTGKPYVFGGTFPESGGTDCDGLVQYAWSRVGVSITRPTQSDFENNVFDQRNGHRADPSEPGDSLFIAGSDGTTTAPGHVMIFVRPGRVFQAEMTGTFIGEFDYDTTVFDFRTRPALALGVVRDRRQIWKRAAAIVGTILAAATAWGQVHGWHP